MFFILLLGIFLIIIRDLINKIIIQIIRWWNIWIDKINTKLYDNQHVKILNLYKLHNTQSELLTFGNRIVINFWKKLQKNAKNVFGDRYQSLFLFYVNVIVLFSYIYFLKLKISRDKRVNHFLKLYRYILQN